MASGTKNTSLNSSYIPTNTREGFNKQNDSGSNLANIPMNSICNRKNKDNKNNKAAFETKYRTMSSSPPASGADTSDLFLSASSQLMGYWPKYEATSRNAQVSFP